MPSRALLYAAALLVLVAGSALGWIATTPVHVPPSALPPHVPDLENGRTLYLAGGCRACHARPGQPNPDALGGGLALATPFGTFYVPNISPHPADGIGAWSEAQFVTAMREGTSPDGRHYYPAFPYTSYRHMRLADLRDVRAYLATLPAMPGKARNHALALPFRLRRALGVWKLLFLGDAGFVPDPQRSAEWNRGAYLVEGPGHCAECHSPHNLFSAVVRSQAFAGGMDLEGRGWVPNITPFRLDWSKRQVVRFLESGRTPDGIRTGSAMMAIVRNTSALPEGDRAAIAAYLKSLPARPGPARPDGRDGPRQAGNLWPPPRLASGGAPRMGR